MIRHDMLNIKRILLHPYELLDGLEPALHDAVVLGRPVELGSYQLFHQFARFRRVVCLLPLSLALSALLCERERGEGGKVP